ELLGLSYRQAKRVWARYRGGGAKALQHGNCGRVSNRAHPEEFRQAVLVQVGRRYADFGPTLAAEHLEEEDGLQVAAETLRRWMNVYVRLPNVQERLRGEAGVTQFGQMCAKLGIRIIAASSPQAKGRVERVHGTHQDRLVKKLRLATVSNYDDANAYLQEHYIA